MTGPGWTTGDGDADREGWPGTLSHDDAWQDVWPKRHTVWRITSTFDVIGHTEAQAMERMARFEETLTALFMAGYDPHPLVRFVQPAYEDAGIPPRLRERETHDTFPYSMMGDTEFYWSWWDPDYPVEHSPDELGDIIDRQWAAGPDAALKLGRIEHWLRAAATFNRPVDAHQLLAMIADPGPETPEDPAEI